MLNPNVRDIQCSIADSIYQEYQKELYGLNACHSDYDEGQMEEWKLLVDLKKSKVTCPKKTSKLDAAGQASKILPVTHAYASVFVMTFVQSNPAGIWLIQHNLGYNPIAEAYNSEGTPIPGSIKYLDKNSLQITFNTIIGGKAYLYQSY